MEKLREILRNKWVGCGLTATLYVLWFVVWTGNLWLLLGLPLIYDFYISRLFYRHVWSRNAKLCERSKLYKTVYEWVNAVIFATIVATLVHLFVFQMYVIPTSSMERSLLVGDYLYVSKVTYGPQMPNTPLSFPFVHHTMPFSQTKKSFSEAVKWPYHRLKGLRNIKRNDVVVFNFPAGDTVLLENQAVTYYDVLRDYEYQYGAERGREELARNYTIITRPVDKRENYIKRCVAIPGDTVRIVDSELFVNGEPQETIPEKQYCYTVRTSSPLTPYAVEQLGVTELQGSGTHYFMPLTEKSAQALREMSNRLEELPGQDAFPMDLSATISNFYSRAGLVKLNNGETGSVTFLGTVSPAGGNLKEPVTESTKKAARCFYALSQGRADSKRYPAIDPLDSYSKYLEYPEIAEYLDGHIGKGWVDEVYAGKTIVQRGKEANDQINILGDDGVPLEYHERFWKSELVDFVILQQDAFDDIDANCPIERQKMMYETVLDICRKEFRFADFEECSQFFKGLINLFRQMNYSEWQSAKFNDYKKQIEQYVLAKTE